MKAGHETAINVQFTFLVTSLWTIARHLSYSVVDLDHAETTSSAS